MKNDGYRLTFESTNRSFIAECCVIGINYFDVDYDNLPAVPNTFDGYDNHLEFNPPLTQPERVELADFMINLWRSFSAEKRSP